MYGLGNVTGGVGDYMDIFDTETCSDRDWNYTRQGYESLFELTGGNPAWGTTVFYLTDAAIGSAAMLPSAPAFETLPYGIEHYYSTIVAAQSSRSIVAHDTLQIMLSIQSGMK